MPNPPDSATPVPAKTLTEQIRHRLPGLEGLPPSRTISRQTVQALRPLHSDAALAPTDPGDTIDPVALLPGSPRAPLEPLAKPDALPSLPRLDLKTGSTNPSQKSEAPGADLEVVGLLGEGGMGKVELARQHSLRREVAIKSTKDCAHDSLAAEALLQEALFMGSLEHPNIIPVHQLGVDGDGKPALVMKRVEGTSWADILDQADHPHWDKVSSPDRLRAHIEILIQVCNAVAFAHSRRVVHRDIKPSNVMLGSFGEVYLVDWGVAFYLEGLRDGDWIVGTPCYMAPEMIEGDHRVCPQTDVFLLGATLHRILSGEPRHRGSSLTEAIAAASTVEPFDYPPEIPPELAELCNQACARHPWERLQSAEIFRRGLASCLENQSSRQLAMEARTKLDELAAMDLDPDSHQSSAIFYKEQALVSLFGECRFGFRQALKRWPGNQEARQGLQSCLEWGIRRAIAQEDSGLAADLLAQLPSPSPELEDERSRLDDRLQRQAQAHRDLQKLEEEHDLTIAWRQRMSIIGTSALGTAIACYISWFAVVTGFFEYTWTVSLIQCTLFFVLMVVVLIVWRHSMMITTLNRRFMGCCLIFGSTVTLNRFLGYALGLDNRAVFMGDLLGGAVCLAVIAIAVDKRLGLFAGLALLGAFSGLLFPGVHELLIQGLSLTVGSVLTFFLKTDAFVPHSTSTEATP